MRRFFQFGINLADDPRVLTAWRRGWEVEHYVRLMRWRDRGVAVRVIYDIGANVGKWSEMAQSIFDPEATYLFEPQIRLGELAMARQPISANWKVLPVALGAAESQSPLNVTQNGAASSLLRPVRSVPEWGLETVRQEIVRVVDLDRYAISEHLPNPDLVKIDVQGSESLVLAGGMKTLATARILVVEASLESVYAGEPLFSEVMGKLVDLGFTLEDISEGARLWPGPPSQVDLWLKKHA